MGSSDNIELMINTISEQPMNQQQSGLKKNSPSVVCKVIKSRLKFIKSLQILNFARLTIPPVDTSRSGISDIQPSFWRG